MKIEITHDRMIRLVGNLIKEVYPNFNKENALHMTWSDGDESYEEYYDPKLKVIREYLPDIGFGKKN